MTVSIRDVGPYRYRWAGPNELDSCDMWWGQSKIDEAGWWELVKWQPTTGWIIRAGASNSVELPKCWVIM